MLLTKMESYERSIKTTPFSCQPNTIPKCQITSSAILDLTIIFCKNFAGLLSFFGQFGKSYSTMSGRYESPRTCTFLAGESEQLVCLLRIAHFPIDPVDMYACICMSCIYISTSVHTSVYTNKCTNGRKKTQIYLRWWMHNLTQKPQSMQKHNSSPLSLLAQTYWTHKPMNVFVSYV